MFTEAIVRFFWPTHDGFEGAALRPEVSKWLQQLNKDGLPMTVAEALKRADQVSASFEGDETARTTTRTTTTRKRKRTAACKKDDDEDEDDDEAAEEEEEGGGGDGGDE